jgi:hypothetical protein
MLEHRDGAFEIRAAFFEIGALFMPFRLIRLAATISLFALILAIAQGCAQPQRPASDYAQLATLRPQHPRLFILDEELPRIRAAAANDDLPRQWHAILTTNARHLVEGKPAARPTEQPATRPAAPATGPATAQTKGPATGPSTRVWEVGRGEWEAIVLLAALYRIDGDTRFADEARREMLKQAAADDWKPNNFLTTARIMEGMAIGYDWLYPVLSKHDRAVIRRAIVNKGLKPGLKAYKDKVWWTTCNHNYSITHTRLPRTC